MITLTAYTVSFSSWSQKQVFIVGPERQTLMIQAAQGSVGVSDLVTEGLAATGVDRPWWAVQADLTYGEDGWQLEWGPELIWPQPLLLLGEEKEEVESPLSFDPHTGLTIMYYCDAQTYRERSPEIVWLFNPWTGRFRKQSDVNNDPQGLLIEEEQ